MKGADTRARCRICKRTARKGECFLASYGSRKVTSCKEHGRRADKCCAKQETMEVLDMGNRVSTCQRCQVASAILRRLDEGWRLTRSAAAEKVGVTPAEAGRALQFLKRIGSATTDGRLWFKEGAKACIKEATE